MATDLKSCLGLDARRNPPSASIVPARLFGGLRCAMKEEITVKIILMRT
jgi:hypothetical protein